LTLPVVAATPGIFAQDGSGLGPGAILNQDYSLNSTLSPAAAGTVIQIYATGGGITSPAVDGFLAPLQPPFPQVTVSPVTVTIGGAPAQVDYKGAAPGLIAGLIQINATVPSGLTPGPVPVVVQIGMAPSQNNLTVFVH